MSFFSEFLHDPNVAAVSPSSPFLMRRLVANLDLANARAVLELGPGDGVATRALLTHLPHDARYFAIERNVHFVTALRGTDPRLTVIEGSAQDVGQALESLVGHIDIAIASIPFTYLTKKERASVCANVDRLLRPGGTFIIFHQYSPLMLPYLKHEFGAATWRYELLNIFPCFLLRASKK